MVTNDVDEIAINSRLYIDKLSCSKATKKLIMKDCVKEFLKHHPELHGLKITQNMMLTQIAKFYLDRT